MRVYVSSFLFFYYYYNYLFIYLFLGGGAENLIFMEEADFVDTFILAHFYAFTWVFLSSR